MSRTVHFLCFLLCFYHLYTQTNAATCYANGKTYQNGEEWYMGLCDEFYCWCDNGQIRMEQDYDCAPGEIKRDLMKMQGISKRNNGRKETLQNYSSLMSLSSKQRLQQK